MYRVHNLFAVYIDPETSLAEIQARYTYVDAQRALFVHTDEMGKENTATHNENLSMFQFLLISVFIANAYSDTGENFKYKHCASDCWEPAAARHTLETTLKIFTYTFPLVHAIHGSVYCV